MQDGPVITDPAPGTTLDYSKGTVTIRWIENGGPKVKNWMLSVGRKDGLWDIIRNKDKQKDQKEDIPVDQLPTSGKVFAQVYGKVDGKDKDGKSTGEDEEIQSEPVWWNCPATSKSV